MELLFAGYATMDIIEGEQSYGGAAAVMAMNARSLGHKASLLSVLAKDRNGLQYAHELRARGVDLNLSYREAPFLPTCTITHPHGTGSLREWDDHGANACIGLIGLTSEDLGRFRAVFLANAHPALVEKVASLKPQNLVYIPGPQIVLKKDYLSKRALNNSRIIFANEEEASLVLEKEPFGGQADYVVVTKGKKGGTVLHRSSKPHDFIADNMPGAVDATGAGDIFALGFSLSILKRKPVSEAILESKELVKRIMYKKGGLL